MKIAIVLGTRPEIIKLAPIIRLLEERNIDYFVIHSNQHYSKNMDAIFFEELNLPQPKYNLGVGSAEHGNQTGKMMIKIEEILFKEKPTVVLAQGDTNTTLAGILTASKQNISSAHIEAGLRSYNRFMPEEKNRIICDAISDFLFAPTHVQEKILKKEGIPNERIFVVGNTVVDAVLQHKKIASKKSSTILQRLNIERNKYVLLTAHRSTNVDRKNTLTMLISLIEKLPDMTGMPVIYPIHPRTKAKLKDYDLNIKNIQLIKPMGYTDFLALEMNAHTIVTDSGGVQEEACILKVPCITIRENTERPETVEVGANRIVGMNVSKLKEALEYFSSHKPNWKNPFGDGNTSKRILEVLQSHL